MVAANGLRDDGRRLDRLGELHSWNPVRSGNVTSSRTGRVRKPTGLRHLATSKWGILREAIRPTDRPQQHSIADMRVGSGGLDRACQSDSPKFLEVSDGRVVPTVIDCTSPELLAHFWAEALHYVIAPPPSGFDSWDDFYRSIGVPEDELGIGLRQNRGSER